MMKRIVLGLALLVGSAVAAFGQTASTYTIANGLGSNYTYRAFNCGPLCTASVPIDYNGSPLVATPTATAPAMGMQVGGQYVTPLPSLSSGQFNPFMLDSSGRLIINCGVGCSGGGGGGGGTSSVDESTFQAGTSVYTPSGGVAVTTGSPLTITSGLQGFFAMTNNRAMWTNLRTSAGAEAGVAASPLQVSLANTGSNGTAVLVTGTGGTFPVTATNLSTNLAQVNGVTTLTGAGAAGAGSARIAVGQDITTIAGSAPGTAGTASSNVVSVQGIGSMTPLLTNPGTATLWGISTQGATTSGQSGILNMGAVTTSAPSYSNGQTSPFSLDTAGNLRVNVVAGGGSGGTSSNFSATFPGTGTAMGAEYLSSPPTYTSGQMVALQTTANGSLHATIDNANANGQASAANSSPVVGATGTIAGGSTSGAGSPATTVVTVQGIGSMTPILSNPGTAANWAINAQGTASSGLLGVLMMGNVTTAAPTYTTAQSDPLSLDTAGNLRINCVTGCSGGGGTSSAFGATFPANGTAAGMSQSGNMVALTGTAGALNINISSGSIANTSFAVTQATASSLNATVVGLGTAGTPSGGVLSIQGVSGGTAVPISATNLSTNLAQVNGVTVLTGAGAVGTGSARIAVGQDTTTIAGSAPGTAGTASTNVLSVQGIASMTPLLANPGTATSWGILAQGSTTSGQVGGLIMGAVTTSAPSYTTAQTSPLSLDLAGNLRINCITGCGGGSGGTSIVDNAAFTQSTTAETPMGCLATGTYAAATANHSTIVSCTTSGSVHTTIDNANANGSATSANSSPVVIASDQAAVAVKGNAASGSAVSGNPVLVAGSDGTNARTLATDTSGRMINVGAGAAGSAVAGNPVLIAGSDGTNARTLLTDTSSRVIVAGAGTAGTATGGVLTIQGVASMTPVASNITQVLGTAISATNGLFTNVLQGNAVLSATNPIFSQSVAGTAGGASTASAIVPNNTTAVVVKSGAGTLYGLQLGGINAAPLWIKFYNATSATCGSGTPVKRVFIPAASTAANGAGSNITFGDIGVAFSTGITYCATTGILDTDTTAPTASNFVINVDFK